MTRPRSKPGIADLQASIEQDGFAILPQVLSGDGLATVVRDVESYLKAQTTAEGSIRSSRGRVYAARNSLAVWPGAIELARQPTLADAVRAILGSGCGLVRAIFFDKPPGRSWSLPWHKDMTIAVRDNRLLSRHFSKPTIKACVPHVEAPTQVLEQMLTARIHLDEVTEENGPLLVVAGSHRSGKDMNWTAPLAPSIQPILVAAGDVLLVRPLVAHSSGNSREGTRRHRRIVHLEFASAQPLADGYDWYDFRSLDDEKTLGTMRP